MVLRKYSQSEMAFIENAMVNIPAFIEYKKTEFKNQGII